MFALLQCDLPGGDALKAGTVQTLDSDVALSACVENCALFGIYNAAIAALF